MQQICHQPWQAAGGVDGQKIMGKIAQNTSGQVAEKGCFPVDLNLHAQVLLALYQKGLLRSPGIDFKLRKNHAARHAILKGLAPNQAKGLAAAVEAAPASDSTAAAGRRKAEGRFMTSVLGFFCLGSESMAVSASSAFDLLLCFLPELLALAFTTGVKLVAFALALAFSFAACLSPAPGDSSWVLS